MQKDFRDLLVLLNEHEVDFMIVGGYALAFHGAPDSRETSISMCDQITTMQSEF